MTVVEKKPYEFLARWDVQGNIQGAHFIQTITVIENNKILSSSQTNPMSITLGIDNGLDLSEVIGEINTELILNIEKANSEKTDLNNYLGLVNKEKDIISIELENSIKSLSKLQDDNLKLNNEIVSLKELISELNIKLSESNILNEELTKKQKTNDSVSE